MTFDLENFTVIYIWSKNSESDVKSITIHAVQSLSNQNDSSWKLILYCKLMKNEMKILSYKKQWIDKLYTIPFSDLKKDKSSMSSNV